MKVYRYLRPFLWALCLSLLTVCASAQTGPEKREYQPSVGQEGKDVVWVPTEQALADRMLGIAQVTPQDYVIDLGSGDGRLVITAAKRGARALGIEYNPDLVELSKRHAAKEGVQDRAQFIRADLFESDFSRATVITMFLLPHINLKLRPKILNLKPGTRIVSTSFNMGEWKPDETIAVTKEEGCEGVYCLAYLWIVPAKVEGAWLLPQGELILSQSFQMLTGVLKRGTDTIPIEKGQLKGDKIQFTVGEAQYNGLITGNAIQGTVKTPRQTGSWSATRKR